MSRIQILNQQELKEFERVSHLKYNEKAYSFSLPKLLLDIALSFQNDSYFLAFTLLFGYFKITHKFSDDIFYNENNIDFIINKYQLKNPVKTVPPRKTLYRYKQIIRDYFQINEYTDEIKSTLQKEANNLANNFIHRKKIFYTLVDLSKKLNIEVPSYTELIRIIQVALNTQKKDILVGKSNEI